MKNFKNKTVVITGAGSGIGRACALEFAKLGANLALNDYQEIGLQQTIRLIEQLGKNTKIVHHIFDVSEREEMYQFAAKVKQNLGNAHVIINNAGIEGFPKMVADLTIEEYRRTMDVDFYGVVHGTKAFMPQILDNKEGAIVNISSIFGLFGSPKSSDYSAAKFAVRGFTEALAIELYESPISVHCVHPGGIKTNITQSEVSKKFGDKFLKTPPEDLAKYLIKCIGKKRQKIVFGHHSRRTWFGAKFIPQGLFNWIAWRKLQEVS